MDETEATPERPSSDVGSTRPFVSASAVLLLVAVELVATLGFGFRDLLSGGERLDAFLAILSAASVAVTLAMVGVVLVDLGLDRVPATSRESKARLVAFVAASFLLGPFLVELTSGRRVRDLPARPFAVAIGTVVLAAVFAFLVSRLRRGPSRWLVALGAIGVVVCAAADRLVLPRLYPAFHLLLGLSALVAALVAAHATPRLAIPRRFLVPLAVVLGLLEIAAGYAIVVVGRAPNTSFVLENRAVVSGKVLDLGARALARFDRPVAQVDISARATSAPGISLAGVDVLLITVDALRADRLRAYGGHGVAPAMDRLAAEGAVFERAYTSTPHTSYALASLLTGKYLRPVFELPNASRDHVTLPDRLRRYGYRTAAFYPPAIFFVDAERFAALEAEGFGFEYRKQMYAPAADRVTQVASYLDEVPRGFPVFVWVHFFEPHEPYDPPRELVHGDGDEALYDGEVAATDRAVDELVRMFRARRPGATVILTADHGEEFQDHGGRYHGSTLYDEQVRVPLIWSSPGVVSPRTIRAPVEHVDLASTLLRAAGMPPDVRMRGDDLGPLLAGSTTEGPRYAFADIADQRMVVDGRYKAICESRAARCQLFDLREDPRERRTIAGSATDVLDRLRGALSSFTASIPEAEAMALADDAAFPPELARAELGDRTVAPELVRLLASPRAEVRVSAARFLGRFGVTEAKGSLEAAATTDADASVKSEAAIAAFSVGSDATRDAVVALAAVDDERGLLAALALASRGDAAGAERLGSCATNARLDEVRRRECVIAVGTSRATAAAAALVASLDDVRLRTDAATVLGRLGDRSTAAALASRLAEERYVPPRFALADALFRLGDRRFEPATRRYLGMASGMPGGLGLLLEAGRIGAPSGRAGDLRGASMPGFTCGADGCRVASDSAVLPTSVVRSGRLVVRVVAGDDTLVRVGSRTFGPLLIGPNELSIPVDATDSANVRVRVDGDATFVAYLVVPQVAEIPPPPPEPWEEAGAADAAPSE